MSEFKREPRYSVLKLADINYALKHGYISDADLAAFNSFHNTVAAARMLRRDKPEPFECVVIESDCRCYETAWDLVEAEHIVNEGKK